MDRFAREGCTRFGSPGILGEPMAGALCLPAGMQVTAKRACPGYTGSSRSPERPIVTISEQSSAIRAPWCVDHDAPTLKEMGVRDLDLLRREADPPKRRRQGDGDPGKVGQQRPDRS